MLGQVQAIIEANQQMHAGKKSERTANKYQENGDRGRVHTIRSFIMRFRKENRVSEEKLNH